LNCFSSSAPTFAHRALPQAEKDDGSIAARFSLAKPGDPLLDDTATEVGIHLSFLSARDRFHENELADLFLSGKPLKPPRLENSWAARPWFHNFLIL